MSAASQTYLDFERPVAELDDRINELMAMEASDQGVDVSDEIRQLKNKSHAQLEKLYAKLGAWQKTQVARHPERPHFLDYADKLVTDYTPLSGDRSFGDDNALLGGPARLSGRPVMIIGHEKGRTTESRIRHNFGMAQPEGYRKAVRLMDLAERFNLPVVSFVDTPGAYPGRGAEERGQSEAIARSTDRCLSLRVPMVSIITGEGGSGGAVAIAVADHVMMLEHSIYSVISPEGCASILWRDQAKAQNAAEAMQITAQHLIEHKIIDEIISEPAGGAHRRPEDAIESVNQSILKALENLSALSPDDLVKRRRDKFLKIGRAT